MNLVQTKHFQTMFWGWKKDVKVVDCPGLVCPSLVGLEIQVRRQLIILSLALNAVLTGSSWQ